jgi:alpha-tubulin suppressor-like RCC1 family protein
MQSLLTIRLICFAFVLLCSLSASGKEGGKKRVKAEGVDELLATYLQLQFVAPPMPEGKSRTHDIGFVEFSPGKGEWPVALAANLVEEQAADGTRSWPFSMREDPVTREIQLQNREGRVIYTLAPEADYDTEWVFRNKFRMGQSSKKTEAFSRFKKMFDPSRIVMTGRLVPALEPDGQEPDISRQASFAPLAMQDAPVMSLIATDTPGVPPAGYSDGLYIQHGTATPYLLRTGGNLRSITQSSSCSLLVFADNSVLGVGYDPRTYNPCAPSMIPPVNAVFNVPADMTNILSVTADCHNYFLFLKNDGRVRGWGQEDNAFGRGDVPASVTNAVAVVAGWMHAAALLTGGRVVEWGYLGASAPGVPASVTNVIALAAGETTTLALRADKKVVEWDYFDGELPVPSNVTNVMSIAKTASHSLALRGDGTVVAWGNNYSGQTDVPACVTNAIAIAAGGSHSMALLQTGELVVWGSDYYGATDIPESASGAIGIHAVDAQCHALLPDGSAVVWGGWGLAGGPPQQPLNTLGANGSCRVLQTAYSESAGDGLLLGVVRATAELFTNGWPTADIVVFGGRLEEDADGDGLTNLGEYVNNTDPYDQDSDGDGLPDGAEIGVPFLMLWDADGDTGLSLTHLFAEQVTASDTLRAARLRDGSLVIFTGTGAALQSYTTNCAALEIDATEAWIAARCANGRVLIGRESGGTVVFQDAGLSGVTDISCGYGHLLALHGSPGTVSCLKADAGGAPVKYTSGMCSGVTDAVKISAGKQADAILRLNNSVRLGDAMTTSYTTKSFTGKTLYDVAAGYNKHYAVLFTDWTALAYETYGFTSTRTLPGAGVLDIASDGDNQLLAILSSGTNGVFTTGGTAWTLAADTNRLLYARDLWWRRNCRLSVSDAARLVPLQNAVGSARKLLFLAAAVTPGGLARGIAAACIGTSPTERDTDRDGLPDGWEVINGFDPRDPSDAYLDTDGDTMSNGWELLNGFNPFDASDATGDADGDGVTNADECARGTDPRNSASVNRTLYADSDIGSDTYDGYWMYAFSYWYGYGYGYGPKASVQQAIRVALSGDVIELRGVPAFADRTLTTDGKAITLVPVGSVRF